MGGQRDQILLHVQVIAITTKSDDAGQWSLPIALLSQATGSPMRLFEPGKVNTVHDDVTEQDPQSKKWRYPTKRAQRSTYPMNDDHDWCSHQQCHREAVRYHSFALVVKTFGPQ